MERRRFLALTAIMAGSALVGCASSNDDYVFTGSGIEDENTSIGNFQGRVKLDEVSGSGLGVLSVYADRSLVGDSGEFQTVASKDGAQLFILTDSAGAMRALGFSIPGSPPQDLGALSTSLMLAYVTRGMLSVDPQEALERLGQVQRQASFVPLLAFVAARLASQSVDDIVADPAFAPLLQGVVDEYLAAQELAVLAQSAIAPVPPDPVTNGNIGLSYRDSNPTRNSQIRLTNASWRFVSVYHQDLDGQGQELPPVFAPVLQEVLNPVESPVFSNILPARGGVSWGALFTGQALANTSGYETLALEDRPAVRRVRYFVYGPGAQGGVAFPPSVQAQVDTFGSDAFALTYFYIGFMPLLDFLGGVTSGFSKATQTAVDAYASLVGTAVNGNAIRQANDAGEDTTSAVVDFLAGVLTLGAAALIVAFGTGTLGGAAAILAGLGAGSSAFFSAINLTAAFASVAGQPSRAQVTIDAPASPLELVRVESSTTQYFLPGDGGHVARQFFSAEGPLPLDWKPRGGAYVSVSSNGIAQGLRSLNASGHLLWSPYIPQQATDLQFWNGVSSSAVPGFEKDAFPVIYGISDAGWVVFSRATGDLTDEVLIWRVGMLQPRVLIPSDDRNLYQDKVDWFNETFVRLRSDQQFDVISAKTYRFPATNDGAIESGDAPRFIGGQIAAIFAGIVDRVDAAGGRVFERPDGSTFTLDPPVESTWTPVQASTDGVYLVLQELTDRGVNNALLWSDGRVVGRVDNAIAVFALVSVLPQVQVSSVGQGSGLLYELYEPSSLN